MGMAFEANELASELLTITPALDLHVAGVPIAGQDLLATLKSH
jgi:hypothetical protein